MRVENQNALAGCEAARLDHDRRPLGAHVVRIERGASEGGETCGGYGMALEELLGESLGALESRGSGAGPEAGAPAGLKGIDGSRDERRLGADNRELDLLAGCERGKRLDVVGRHIDIADTGLERGSGVARSDQDGIDSR